MKKLILNDWLSGSQFKSGIQLFVALLLILAVILPSSCARKPEKVKIGYLPIAGSLPLYVALEKGYFQKQGLQVESISFPGSPQLADALIAGRIDVEFGCALGTLYSIEQRMPNQFKIFMVGAQTKEDYIDYVLVKKDSPISNPSDLKGKKIGTFPGPTAALLTRLILKEFLEPEKDITIVPMPPPNLLEALIAGSVDAIFTLEPTVSIALERKVAKILMEGPQEKYILDPNPSGGHAFSIEFVNKYSKVADKVKIAFFKALDFVREDEEEARKTITKYTQTPETIIYKMSLNIFWKTHEIDKDAMQRLADLLFKEKILTKSIETSRIYY